MTGSSNARYAKALASSPGPIKTGKVEVPVGGGPVAFPEMEGQYISFKAGPDNAEAVYIHGEGSADGWPLDSGEETGIKPVSGTHRYEYSGAEGDVIYYELIP